MKAAYITSGAAGMYCGSCMRDNTLVAALCKLGHDALLIPTYTPIRTDEEDVSQSRVFFGGVNVYLQQKFALFRLTPWFFDRLLDVPRFLRWVSRFGVKTQARDLAELTLSMLDGSHGKQRKEVAKLVGWLTDELKPDIINLSNALIAGMLPDLKQRFRGPVLCSLQGDDIFTEFLPAPYRSKALTKLRELCGLIDGFIATSVYYADFMAGYFAIPREKIHVVYPGINLAGHGDPPRVERPFTIGYFARICPEKGFQHIVEAFRLLRQQPGTSGVRLHVSGYLGENNRAFYQTQVKRLEDAGLLGDFSHVECPKHADKVRFLQSIDVLSVPTTYREPKGLYVLEALANATPVVQPRHGSFPELVDLTGGGILVEPDHPAQLADALHGVVREREKFAEMGRRGQAVVRERFNAGRMAADTVAVYQRYLA